MVTCTVLQKYLDDFLYFDKTIEIAQIDPHMANGLMVRGKEEVKTIGFSVSSSLVLFRKAHEEKCDAIIVHHSFNIPPYNRYDKIFQDRIGYLIKSGISLFGYHFLLDAHPKIGNNVRMLKVIGARPMEPYLHNSDPWGWIGVFDKEEDMTCIEERLHPFLSPRAIFYRFGPKKVKRVVTISGKGAPYPSSMHDLLEKNIDLYITGEVHEWNRELFKEAKINCISGGHYATEVFGIKTLMEKVQQDFPEINVKWLDVYNDV